MRPLIVLAFFITATATQAARFKGRYCEFELPQGWDCNLKGAEWVCQSKDKDRAKEATIVLSSQKRGPMDSFIQYTNHLKKGKVFQAPGGRKRTFKPSYSKVTSINGHNWVDALYLSGEVSGFYTRYLATIKGGRGILVTFSTSKNHYNTHKEVLEKVANTLRVFRLQGRSTAGTQQSSYPLSGEGLGTKANQERDWGDKIPDGSGGKRQDKKKGEGDNLFIWIIIAGIVGLVVFKLKAKKKSS